MFCGCFPRFFKFSLISSTFLAEAKVSQILRVLFTAVTEIAKVEITISNIVYDFLHKVAYV